MAKKKQKKPAGERPDLERLDLDIDRFLKGSEGAALSAGPAQGKERPPAPAPAPGSKPERAESKPENPDRKAAERSRPLREKKQSPKLSLLVSDDGLQATLRAIYPATTGEEIYEFLDKSGVTVGIDKPAIRKALKTVLEAGEPVRDVIVAEGRPPRPPAPPRIENRPPGGQDSYPPLDPVARLLSMENRAELEAAAAELSACPVRPGDILAVLVVDAGEPGKDVRGRPIPPEPSENDLQDARYRPGEGVTLAGNGVDYTAATCGYAGLRDGRASVLAPVWISKDGLEACILNLAPAPASGPPSPDEVKAMLKAVGVTEGIDDTAVRAYCDRLKAAKPADILYRVARGRPPEPPRDGRPDFSFPYESQIGAIQPDGSIDYRERNRFPPVEKGALLVQSIPAVPGVPGKTVRGEEISVSAPASVELEAGENVRLDTQGNVQKLYAEIDGAATVQTSEVASQEGRTRRYKIAVRPVAQIAGDVNYETGNIDFRGNVEIRGSVTGGFRVKASGDIAVGGGVEAGATLKSGGSVTVRQGVVGDKTCIEAAGAVAAKFIQEARVAAGGDVIVGSYIHNADVRSRGRVLVEGRGGSGGGIVGGRTWAIQGIASRNIGSERSTSTFLAAGVDPDQYAEFQKARQAAGQAENLVGNLLKALGLKALKSEEIRNLILRDPARKNTILHYVKKANELAQTQEKHLQEAKSLGAKIQQAARGASLDVQDRAYARVRVRIGSQEVQTQDDLKAVRFQADRDGGIVHAPLTK